MVQDKRLISNPAARTKLVGNKAKLAVIDDLATGLPMEIPIEADDDKENRFKKKVLLSTMIRRGLYK